VLIPILGYGQRSDLDTRTLTGPLLDQAEVKPGGVISTDLVVYSESGEKTTLLEVVNGKHTVLVSGCLTCPIFHRTYPGVEAVYQDYRDREDIQFFYLYKSLAHPEYNGYIQPVNIDERLAHIVEAKRVLDTSLNWLCDGMDNAVRHTLGFGPNTQMVIDPSGTIVHALGWSDGEVLRKELVKFVGDSETHTQVSELSIRKRPSAVAQKTVQSGISNSPSFNETLVPVLMTAKDAGKHPLYVKPRIEVTPSVFQRGRGEMYLGFHLDPIHHVHWNNLAAPLQYELELPEGMYMTPKRAAADEMKVDADSDPREFVIEITGSEPGSVFDLTFHYFACSDEEGWCVPVTQKYEVALAADLDGGGTMGRSFNRGGGRQNTAQAGRGGPGGRPPQSPEQLKQRIMQSDTDGDGKISESEAPEQMSRGFAQADQNSDGFLDQAELDAFASQFRPGGPGGQRPGGPGGRGPGGQGPGGPGGGGGNPAAQLMNFDNNGDGKISQDELPEQMQGRFERMDENGDGVIDEEEIEAMAARFQGGQGRQQPPRGGRRGGAGRDNI